MKILSDKHDAYYEMLADLYKKVNQYRSVFEKSNERVKSYKSMVKYISGNRNEVEKKVAALAEKKNNLLKSCSNLLDYFRRHFSTFIKTVF